MKIFFTAFHIEKTPPAFPLAAAILKTAILEDKRTSGNEVIIREYYLPAEISSIAEEIISDGADVCCLTACTWNSSEIIKLAAKLKKLKNNIRLIVGGPQATADSRDFSRSGHFDCIIAGEGEAVIADAVLGRNVDSSELKAPAAEFEKAPSPYPVAPELIEKHDGILWEVSRGCPYNCSFCYESKGGSRVRTVSDERLKSELELFKSRSIQNIWVLDPTFNHNRRHAGKVLESISEIYPEAHYTFEIRAELMDEATCGMLSELNASLQIGLQTTNPVAGKFINRKLKPEKFLEKCRIMADYNLTFGIDLIYGLPGDDFRGFCESVNFAVQACPNNLDIFPLSVLPGTELADRADELGLKNTGFPLYEIIENRSFKREDIKKAANLTRAVDLLYNREQAFAWFNTAASALELTPVEMFEGFNRHRNNDALDFIRDALRRKGNQKLLQVVDSFIRWSRAAETAFANPGREITVKLCRKPEILDELSRFKPEEFLRRHPSGKDRNYRLLFDGEELYIR